MTSHIENSDQSAFGLFSNFLSDADRIIDDRLHALEFYNNDEMSVPDASIFDHQPLSEELRAISENINHNEQESVLDTPPERSEGQGTFAELLYSQVMEEGIHHEQNDTRPDIIRANDNSDPVITFMRQWIMHTTNSEEAINSMLPEIALEYTDFSSNMNTLEQTEKIKETNTEKIIYNHETLADDSCSICVDTYKENDELMLISGCGHYFHKDCVNSWFETKLNCPLCRHELK